MSTPVAPRERLASLDVLRGFALCGVMIGNMVLYSGRFAMRGRHAGPRWFDEVGEWFLQIVVESKAQTTLTLLFGFGFAMQLLRAERRGEPVLGLYARRMLALFALGALHVSLLWWGDVTWGYSIAGLGMLAFVRASNRTRVIAALIFIFVPSIVMAWPGVMIATVRVVMDPSTMRAEMERIAAAIHRDAHGGLAWAQVRFALVWTGRIYAWYFLWLLGRFLLGYVAGQRRWFDRDGADHLPVFRRLAAWGGAAGAVTTALAVLMRLEVLDLYAHGTWGRAADAIVEQVGLLAMTSFYVGVVVLLMQRAAWRRVLTLVAPAGRMPLTTYFSQSLVCTFLFYGWGLGWAGHVGVAGCIGLAIAIYVVQVAVAHLWLSRFQFGPLEWVWRTAVYLKRQPMRLA